MPERFAQKRALVTGAAGGIGRELLAALQREGASVAVADIQTTGLEAALHLPGNLMDSEYADRLAVSAADGLGGLDMVFNNAGVIRRGTAVDTDDDDWTISIAVNIEAPFRISRAAVPVMAAGGGGVIVNTSSCWGLRPGPGHAVYCMTKAAIASLTQCMGRDHAHQGIRINAVCPNEVDTPMLRSGFSNRGFDPATAIETLGATVPLGRIATPQDIVDVMLFLASDDARYLCGSLIEVNGGKPVG